MGILYYRLNPQLSVNVDLDETSDEIIINMLFETKAYMHQNFNIVKEIVELILK